MNKKHDLFLTLMLNLQKLQQKPKPKLKERLKLIFKTNSK